MPLKSQVSFNKDRNFTLLKRTTSLRKEAEDDKKEDGKKDDKKEGRWQKLRKSDANNRKISPGASPSIASSLAATLSPFSSFVSNHTPNRKSPVSFRRSKSPQPADFSPVQAPRSPLRHSWCELDDHSKPKLPRSSSERTDASLKKPKIKITFSDKTRYTSKTQSDESESTESTLVDTNDSTSLKRKVNDLIKVEEKITKADEENRRFTEKEKDKEITKTEQIKKADGIPKGDETTNEVKENAENVKDEITKAEQIVFHHRKTCQSCRCTRELHDVYHEDWVNVRERLGLGDTIGRNTREICLQEGYSYVPPGLVSEQIYDYMSCLPGHKVPRLGTPGEKYRERQLMLQLPKQDLSLAFTRHVEPQYHTSYKDFIQARNDIALDIGIVKHHIPQTSECRGCKNSIPKGSVAVIAARLGDDAIFHPHCFSCGTCKELLVDLVYCIWGESLHCGRHYAEKLKPRCAACDELIFSGEYTKAMSKDWHSGHFCCWQCDDSLTGERYVLKDDHPYCIKCYESIFANSCDECSTIIGIDSKDLSYKDRHWHEKCFLCTKCNVSLVDKQFGSKQERIYCGPCYDALFASRCDACGEVFRAGNKKMEYRQRQWHEKCFCCCVCKTAIGTKSFIPRDQEIYCTTCYEEKFATRCIKCNKIITTGGVTYKNEPWHRECFTCTNCDLSLAGQRFTSRDEKPYCADCFGELFAKRCTSCDKPITGIGGTRFISFEDRHWHNDCFICAMCKKSLVGKGFITDGADILCPDCATQKLM